MKITICRCGKFPQFNRKRKGLFIKEFKDIEELVKFYWDSYPALYYPNLHNDITKKEYEIFIDKLSSYRRKSRDVAKW